jgi:Ca2+-binding EF-hand superfamily protein
LGENLSDEELHAMINEADFDGKISVIFLIVVCLVHIQQNLQAHLVFHMFFASPAFVK